MKKIKGKLLLIICVAVFLMSCTREKNKEIDKEIIETIDQKESKDKGGVKEAVEDEAGFVGGMIDVIEEDTEVSEEIAKEPIDDSDNTVQKENEDENSIKEDLLEPPAKSSANVIELK